MDTSANNDTTSDIKLWILLAINCLLLAERVVKGAKVIKCSWRGCSLSNITPPPSEESGSPIKLRKKKKKDEENDEDLE